MEKADGTGKCIRCRSELKEKYDSDTGQCIDCPSCEYLSMASVNADPEYFAEHKDTWNQYSKNFEYFSYVRNVGECKPLTRRSLVLDGNTLTISGVDQYAKDITHTNHEFLKREPADLEDQYAIRVSTSNAWYKYENVF